jgi:hypothetical protein
MKLTFKINQRDLDLFRHILLQGQFRIEEKESDEQYAAAWRLRNKLCEQGRTYDKKIAKHNRAIAQKRNARLDCFTQASIFDYGKDYKKKNGYFWQENILRRGVNNGRSGWQPVWRLHYKGKTRTFTEYSAMRKFMFKVTAKKGGK